MAWSRPLLRLAALIALMTLAPAFALDSEARAQDYTAGLKAYDRGAFEEAVRILQPLAEGGDARAQYGMGKIYETGGGRVSADPGKAVSWYGKAAKQGVAAAQNNLALMYAEGRGVAQNKEQALVLWETAARGGHPQAQYNLGLMFYRGEGVERDSAKAVTWFKLAADNGLAEAQFAVAEMHRLGVGVPQDNRKALGWYQMASAQGHEAARVQANRLRGQDVSPAEVEGGDPPPPAEPAAARQQAASVTQQTAEAPPPPEPTPRPEPQEAPQAKAGQATAPETRTEASQASQSTQQVAAVPPASPASGGDYSLWLGSMNEEGAAEQMSNKLTAQYGEALGGADLSVRRAEVGASDVFYRVVAGSWPSRAEARGACTALRRSDPAAFCKVLRD